MGPTEKDFGTQPGAMISFLHVIVVKASCCILLLAYISVLNEFYTVLPTIPQRSFVRSIASSITSWARCLKG